MISIHIKIKTLKFDEKNTTLNNYDDLAANFGPNVPDDGFQVS